MLVSPTRQLNFTNLFTFCKPWLIFVSIEGKSIYILKYRTCMSVLDLCFVRGYLWSRLIYADRSSKFTLMFGWVAIRHFYIMHRFNNVSISRYLAKCVPTARMRRKTRAGCIFWERSLGWSQYCDRWQKECARAASCCVVWPGSYFPQLIVAAAHIVRASE